MLGCTEGVIKVLGMTGLYHRDWNSHGGREGSKENGNKTAELLPSVRFYSVT